jgi:hypothetical protein
VRSAQPCSSGLRSRRDPYDSWILAGSKLFAKLQTLAFGQRVAFDGFVARLVMGPADKPQAVGLIVKFTDIRPAG